MAALTAPPPQLQLIIPAHPDWRAGGLKHLGADGKSALRVGRESGSALLTVCPLTASPSRGGRGGANSSVSFPWSAAPPRVGFGFFFLRFSDGVSCFGKTSFAFDSCFSSADSEESSRSTAEGFDWTAWPVLRRVFLSCFPTLLVSELRAGDLAVGFGFFMGFFRGALKEKRNTKRGEGSYCKARGLRRKRKNDRGRTREFASLQRIYSEDFKSCLYIGLHENLAVWR